MRGAFVASVICLVINELTNISRLSIRTPAYLWYSWDGTAVTSANLKKSANAIPLFPWQHLTRNYRADKEYATPAVLANENTPPVTAAVPTLKGSNASRIPNCFSVF